MVLHIKSKKITVVIPTKDRPSELARALRSALSQTLPPHEIIIVDTLESVDERVTALISSIEPSDDKGTIVASKKILYIHLPKANGGLARNRAIQLASGDLIAFLDDDDEWHENKLATQVRHFPTDSKNSCIVSYCKCTKDMGRSGTSTYPMERINPAEPVFDYIFKSNQGMQTSGLVVPLALALRVGFPDVRKHQDYRFIRALEKCQAKFVMASDDPLYRWDCNPEHESMSRKPDLMESLKFVLTEKLTTEQTWGFIQKQRVIQQISYTDVPYGKLVLLVLALRLTSKPNLFFNYLGVTISAWLTARASKRFVSFIERHFKLTGMPDSVLCYGVGEIFELHLESRLLTILGPQTTVDRYTIGSAKFFPQSRTWSKSLTDLKEFYDCIIVCSIGSSDNIIRKIRSDLVTGKIKTKFILSVDRIREPSDFNICIK